MIRALLRFLLFSYPINILSGLQYIIFENAEIFKTEFYLDNRTEMKLEKDVNTLENNFRMETKDNG
jgi:hypothetical protein